MDTVKRDPAQSGTTIGGYPKNIDNPDDWAMFLARYLDNRVTNEVHNGIGLVALHIVDAIKEARVSAIQELELLERGKL